MRFFRFDRAMGAPLTSATEYLIINSVLTRVAHISGDVEIDCVYMGPRGRIGYQQAEKSHLFLVIQGDGWVRTEDNLHHNIGVGQAVFWQAGEWCETATPYGLTAIVISSENLDPGQLLKEISL